MLRVPKEPAAALDPLMSPVKAFAVCLKAPPSEITVPELKEASPPLKFIPVKELITAVTPLPLTNNSRSSYVCGIFVKLIVPPALVIVTVPIKSL